MEEHGKQRQKIYFFWKRLFDVFFSLFGLICLSPVMAVVFFICWVDTKAFPIFRQKRSGKNKKPFLLLKFRSMKRGAPSNITKDNFDTVSGYITKFGRFIRKTSIDELPQLVNVLIGEMSIIGPRPAICTDAEWIEERDKYAANSIRPGITGLAQISGRDTLSRAEKAKLDGEYARRISFLLDFQIFFRTIRVVLTKKGLLEERQG